MAYLVIERGGDEVLRIALTGGVTRVGRSPECHVILPDPAISRVHCWIEEAEDGWTVADAGSPSGFVLDGQAVTTAGEAQPLQDGSVLELGSYRVVFRARAASSSADETRAPAREPTRILAVKKGRVVYEEASLSVADGPDAGKSFTLRREINVIGKNPDCDVPLTDTYISSEHCRLEQSSAGWRLIDLGSTNGTRVNGVRVREGTLPNGARIELGQTALVLETDTEERALPPVETPQFHGMIGSTPEMRNVFALLQAAATTDAPVMVLGPSGAGKELAARALHTASHRADGPFIALNCGGLSPNLVESEFFGHEKGAFTGADRRRLGAFERVAGGTLFLDEVGELGPDLQAKLLRVLETGDFHRVGGNETLHTDGRIVCATHRNLTEMIKSGEFREDLFYRMAVVPLQLPPLAARRDDIPLLAQHLLEAMSPGPAPALTPPAMDALRAHDWPGNVRELRNVLQRSLLFAQGGPIDSAHLALNPLDVEDHVAQLAEGGQQRNLQDAERAAIRAALKKTGGNKKAAAQLLGIARSTLHEKIKRLGIQPE